MPKAGPIDLDMCATDMAKMLDRYGYADVSSKAIRPELEEFIRAVNQNQAGLDAQQPGQPAGGRTYAANQSGFLPPKTGRRPRATFKSWWRSQLVNLGATGQGQWYWQCPTSGCKAWAGPYPEAMIAKEAGFGHVYRCQVTNYFRR
jgi:hypothetical protein